MNPNAKLTVLGGEDFGAGAEDYFLCEHDHNKCIEAEKKAKELEMDGWLKRLAVAPNARIPKMLVPPPRPVYSALKDMKRSNPQEFLEWQKLHLADPRAQAAKDKEWLRKYEEELEAECLRAEAMLMEEERKTLLKKPESLLKKPESMLKKPESVLKKRELSNDGPTTTKLYKRRIEEGELEGKTKKEQVSECVENIQSDH